MTTRSEHPRGEWGARVAAAILAVAGLCLPVSAAAQVTVDAFVPSWTNSRLTIFDASTGALVAPITLGGEPYDAAVTPDGRRAYVTQRASNTVTVIDVATHTIVATISVGLVPRDVAITPDGTRAYVTEASSNTVSAIDIATNTLIGAPIPVGVQPWGIAITPDGGLAVVVDRTSSTVSVIKLGTPAVIAILPVDREPVEVAIAPDGDIAYVTSTLDNTVVPIDLHSLSVLPSIPVGLFPRSLALTPDGTQIFVANSNADTVSVIDAATRTVSAMFTTGALSIPSGMAITPNGRYALVGTQGTFLVRAIDVATHATIGTVAIGGQALRLATGPNMIVRDVQGRTLNVASDADLASGGFGRFIVFSGGALTATGNWSTPRTVSLLAPGGTIDTRNFEVELAGGVINDGTLIKRGAGTLRLRKTSTHPATDVEEGTLVVVGAHQGDITVAPGGTLAGTGTVANVSLSPHATISPGGFGAGILHAQNVTMGVGATLLVEIGGALPGSGYDQLAVSGTAALNGATLALHPTVAVPSNTKLLIVTNTTGTFAGLPEGAIILTAFQKFRITYIGGTSGHDVILTAS
jgi:YVTN family beta-propeller protein